MTHFGSFLGQVIAADYDGSQKRFSDACGINPPQATRYLRHGDLPGAENLGRILLTIKDPAKQVELYKAYISDFQEKTKAGIPFEVGISLRGQANERKVDREIAAILEVLRARAAKNAKFRQILKDIAGWPD